MGFPLEKGRNEYLLLHHLTFKRRNNALSSLKIICLIIFRKFTFHYTVPDKIYHLLSLSTRLVASPVNGRVGPSSVVVEQLVLES